MVKAGGFSLVVCAALAAAAEPAPAKLRVAVLGLENSAGVSTATANVLDDVVATEVAAPGTFQVMTPKELSAALGFERQKQLLGCTEQSSCMAELTSAMGVQYLVTGQVGQLGSSYRVSLALVNASTAQAVARVARQCEKSDEALAGSAQAAVRELFASAGFGQRPGLSTAGLVFVGTGAVALAAGAVVGVLAKGQYDTLASKQSQTDYPAVYARDASTVKTLALAADGLFVVGAACAITGAVLLVRGPASTSTSVSVAPLPGGGAVAVAGSF